MRYYVLTHSPVFPWQVLTPVHQVVVDNTAKRFGDVRSDIHATRQKILEGTANNMQIMQRERYVTWYTLLQVDDFMLR